MASNGRTPLGPHLKVIVPNYFFNCTEEKWSRWRLTTKLCLEAVLYGLEIGGRSVRSFFLLWLSEGRTVADANGFFLCVSNLRRSQDKAKRFRGEASMPMFPRAEVSCARGGATLLDMHRRGLSQRPRPCRLPEAKGWHGRHARARKGKEVAAPSCGTPKKRPRGGPQNSLRQEAALEEF